MTWPQYGSTVRTAKAPPIALSADEKLHMLDPPYYNFSKIRESDYPPQWQVLSSEERLILCDLVISRKLVNYTAPTNLRINSLTKLKVLGLAHVFASKVDTARRTYADYSVWQARCSVHAPQLLTLVLPVSRATSLWELHGWLLQKADGAQCRVNEWRNWDYHCRLARRK